MDPQQVMLEEYKALRAEQNDINTTRRSARQVAIIGSVAVFAWSLQANEPLLAPLAFLFIFPSGHMCMRGIMNIMKIGAYIRVRFEEGEWKDVLVWQSNAKKVPVTGDRSMDYPLFLALTCLGGVVPVLVAILSLKNSPGPIAKSILAVMLAITGVIITTLAVLRHLRREHAAVHQELLTKWRDALGAVASR